MVELTELPAPWASQVTDEKPVLLCSVHKKGRNVNELNVGAVRLYNYTHLRSFGSVFGKTTKKT